MQALVQLLHKKCKWSAMAAAKPTIVTGFRFFASKWIKKSGIFETVGSEMATLFCGYQSSKWPIMTHTFQDEGPWDALNLSIPSPENDIRDSEWCKGTKHEGANATDSDGISDWMAVFETSEVAVMEVWLNESPDPKANVSWATKGPLQSFCTWCSLVQWLLGISGIGQKA